MPSNTAIYIYVVVSVIAIAALAGFLIKCKNESFSLYDEESFHTPTTAFGVKHEDTRDLCLCTGGGTKLCANRDKLKASYLEGNTEFQDFGELQKKAGGAFWHSTDFNNY